MTLLLHICCAPCANAPIASLREKGIDLGYTEVYEYLRLFRKVERQYKGLCIVDVESADGDKVKIYL